MLAYEDAEGKVWLAYITGDFLKSRHGIKGNDELMKRVNGVTDSIAGKALE